MMPDVVLLAVESDLPPPFHPSNRAELAVGAWPRLVLVVPLEWGGKYPRLLALVVGAVLMENT